MSSPSRFAAAVAEHPFTAFELDAGAVAHAGRALTATGLLVIGEPHGVRETPSVLYALARALETRSLAFEWSHEEMEEPIRDALRRGSFDFERLWSLPASSEFFCGDGRITAGHFALVHRLRCEGRLDHVIAFDRLDAESPDGPEGEARRREREMASRLLREWDRSSPLIVLTGAFHAQLQAPGCETMAAHLARALPGLEPAVLRYAGGHCRSRGVLHDVGPMPDTPITVPCGDATPAVVPAPAV